MLYENYKNLKVYNSQTKIALPRHGVDMEDDALANGKGSLIFLLTPSFDKALGVLKDDSIGWKPSMYKSFTTDTYFRRKICAKSVVSNEKIAITRRVKSEKDLDMTFYTPQTVRSATNNKKNLVVDLSRWMELFFTHKVNNAEKACAAFLSLLKDQVEDPRFNAYKSKIIMIDLNSWCSASSCVLMNRKLLNNPLAIFFYSAVYYPELWNSFPDIRIMVTNRSASQVLLFNPSEVTKKTYPKVKGRIKLLKNLVISIEDETEADEMSDEEVKAEIVHDFKDRMKKEMKAKLKDDPKDVIPDPFTASIDLTKELEDMDDEDNGDTDNASDDEDADEAISKAVDEYVDNQDDDAVFDDPKDAADQQLSTIRKNVYMTSFMPERSEKEKAKIERLAVNQDAVIKKAPPAEAAKKKIIDTSVFPERIENNNPNLAKTRFGNFDKNYVDKCMESDIDNSVAGLSNASAKIFITGKEVIDSSTPMDIKETWVYHIEDEKGNRKSIRLDIPKVIDGSYVFLNGSKKQITHQFVLKPLVKSGPDTVQLVTAYNKVFIRRRGKVDANTNMLIAFLQKNETRFKVKFGNYSMMNKDYETPLDFVMMSKYFSEFTIGKKWFSMDIDSILKTFEHKFPSAKKLKLNFAKEIPLGIDMETKSLIIFQLEDNYTDFMMNQFDPKDKDEISKIKRRPKLIMAAMKINKKDIPVVVFCMYCEGFSSVMQKAGIEYKFVDAAGWKSLNKLEWDGVKLEDCIVAWKRKGILTPLLMNGLKGLPLENFTKDELESKDTYNSLIASYWNNNFSQAYTMDNYRDFLLDAKTKEILEDFNLPTDLVSILLTAVNMLGDNKFLPENNMANMRVRSAEVIPDIVYLVMTQAYEAYRKQAYKKNALKFFTVQQSAVIDALLRSSANSSKGKKREIVTNLVVEASVLNPVLELEKSRAVTYKGLRGIQLERAMTLPRRAYDKSMLGVCGISTSPDQNVGIVRQLTLEPNITSTRGYIDTSSEDDPDSLNSSQLFTTAELLTPIGVTHDDPDRTSMSYKQTKYMISVEDADPVMIGNRVEAITPYILSDEFVVTAKDDGKVIDIDGGYVIVEYKNGKREAIDIAPRVRKNAAAGFYVDNTLTCDLKIGDKFKKDAVLAYNNKHFTKHEDDDGASMNLGVLTKVAIVSTWDIYEDSTPITSKLSRRLATEMINEKAVTLDSNTIVDYIVDIGQPIKTSEPLIKFSRAMSDEMQRVFDSMRDDNTLNEISEDTKTTITSKYTGTVVDIKIYSTVPVDSLDPSLAKIVKKYNKRINARNAVLTKYQNEGDMNYFKAGQIISETSDLVTPNRSGKVKGQYLQDGVLILFYIKYKDIAAKGDKVCANFALKGVTSHVIEEGLEPYSEYRPDEEISTLIAPLSVAARKVPSIFLAMFGNKCLIELKRQLKQIYLGKDSPVDLI